MAIGSVVAAASTLSPKPIRSRLDVDRLLPVRLGLGRGGRRRFDGRGHRRRFDGRRHGGGVVGGGHGRGRG